MIYTDSHMHTSFSSDSNTPMEKMIVESIRLGLTSICFTDHYDIDFPPIFEGLDFDLDTPAYLNEFYRLKEIYGNDIDLRIGVELGVMPDTGEKIRNYLKKYGDTFDFVLGSTHLVERMDPYLPDYYNRFEDERDGIRRYFIENIENIKGFDGMDSFGHYDYAVRYAPHKDEFYVPSDYMNLIDQFLKTLIQKGIALEFNTAGLKYGMKQANPHIDILKRYRELGGELLTIGADGHKPEHIAWDFKKGYEILRKAGFTYYTIYRNRRAEMLPLSK